MKIWKHKLANSVLIWNICMQKFIQVKNVVNVLFNENFFITFGQAVR